MSDYEPKPGDWVRNFGDNISVLWAGEDEFAVLVLDNGSILRFRPLPGTERKPATRAQARHAEAILRASEHCPSPWPGQRDELPEGGLPGYWRDKDGDTWSYRNGEWLCRLNSRHRWFGYNHLECGPFTPTAPPEGEPRKIPEAKEPEVGQVDELPRGGLPGYWRDKDGEVWAHQAQQGKGWSYWRKGKWMGNITHVNAAFAPLTPTALPEGAESEEIPKAKEPELGQVYELPESGLRGYWRDRVGDIWHYRNDEWLCRHNTAWVGGFSRAPRGCGPFTPTSIPEGAEPQEIPEQAKPLAATREELQAEIDRLSNLHIEAQHEVENLRIQRDKALAQRDLLKLLLATLTTEEILDALLTED